LCGEKNKTGEDREPDPPFSGLVHVRPAPFR
jgi:hypothetical protein